MWASRLGAINLRERPKRPRLKMGRPTVEDIPLRSSQRLASSNAKLVSIKSRGVRLMNGLARRTPEYTHEAQTSERTLARHGQFDSRPRLKGRIMPNIQSSDRERSIGASKKTRLSMDQAAGG
jgi:hypothetical protein